MITLRELGPNDACFCGSGRKLKKCCKKSGYFVGPNMVVQSTMRRAAGGMELLSAAAESGTRVTPDMGMTDIYRAIPPERRAAALLDTYSITLPARVYEETNCILGRMDYAWFLYAQNIPYVASVHDPEGMTPEKLQLVGESASRWLWNECGRDGEPPKLATVENMSISMQLDTDFEIHMRTAEGILTLLGPENLAKSINMWVLGRIVHRSFGGLFREAPVGENRLDCQCDRCRTRPHPKTCTCTLCSNVDMVNKSLVVLRSDPVIGRTLPQPITQMSAAEIRISQKALDLLGRTIIMFDPEQAQRRLKEAFEAAQNGETAKARVMLKALRAEAEDAIATLKPYADRTYNDGALVADLLARFESMNTSFEKLQTELENLP